MRYIALGISMYFTVLQKCGRVAVELAFPECGVWRLYDGWEQDYDLFIKLVTGEIAEAWEEFWHRDDGEWGLIAGSKAEGFAMDPAWGHGQADIDGM